MSIRAIALALLLLPVPLLRAQDTETEDAPPAEDVAGESIPGVTWTPGPAEFPIGSLAELDLGEGYRMTDSRGTRALLELMGNRTGPSELALLAPEGSLDWFVVFSFSDVGYVPDSDKDDLDAEELLETLRSGNAESNRYRKAHGMPEMELLGWEMKPRYNEETNNLEWAIRGRSDGALVLNYNVRILGRTGVMTANLVIDPTDLQATLPVFQGILERYSYREGNRYSEYRKGDKLAEYGLKGLIAGGALAVAAKTGLLQKFWKLIVVALAGIAGLFKKIFGGRGGGGKRPTPRAGGGAA